MIPFSATDAISSDRSPITWRGWCGFGSSSSIGITRPTGSLVLVSGEGGRFAGPIGRILRGILLSLTPGARVKPLAAVPKAEVTRDLAALALAGRLRPVIEREVPLADARAALAHLDAGHTVGKVVVLA